MEEEGEGEGEEETLELRHLNVQVAAYCLLQVATRNLLIRVDTHMRQREDGEEKERKRGRKRHDAHERGASVLVEHISASIKPHADEHVNMKRRKEGESN